MANDFSNVSHFIFEQSGPSEQNVLLQPHLLISEYVSLNENEAYCKMIKYGYVTKDQAKFELYTYSKVKVQSSLLNSRDRLPIKLSKLRVHCHRIMDLA